MTPDLDSLKVLDAVARSASFAQAADELERAQSAVSYQISKLERQLGAKLFDRSQYRATLTPLGVAVLKEGRRLLQQARHLAVLARRWSDGWEPALELVIDGALPMDPVMRALKQLSDSDIPTRIQLKVEFLRGVQMRFEQDEADLMLVKDYSANPGLVAKPLPQIANVLVVAPEHPLAQQQQVSRAQLQEYVELTVNDSSSSDEVHPESHQFGGDRVFFLSGFIYKKRALTMGLGFGWMPEFLIQQELQDGTLRRVDYRGGAEYRFTPRLVYSDQRPLGRTGSLLMQTILDQYR